MSGIDFWCELDGEEELERGIDAGLRSASDGIRNAVAEGLRSGVDYAKRNHLYQDQSGKLTSSIDSKVEVSTPGGAVGVIFSKTKYDRFVEKGTEAHEIKARKAKALHWDGPGGERFAKTVMHPGTAPKPFMQPAALAARDHIERSIELDIVMNLEKHIGGE